MAQSPITMPALGRPFSLGMLYDCRSDQLIPGMTLWDPELLQTNVRKTAQPASDFEIIMEDSLENKLKALNVEAELKLSAYCGLCKVSGAAKYMNDRCTSLRQSRVSLQYKSTSRFEQLTMTQLGRGNVQHPHVFDDDIATHVVTGMTYGADAFMIFDYTASSAEETTQLKGTLKAELDVILAQINVTGEVAPKNDEKSVSSKTKCTFYSDFSSAENPVTFKDAVELYKKLPSLCGPNGEKTVPKSIYLYPLCKLDSKGQPIVRPISEGLVHQTMETLEAMHRMRMTINDLLPHNEDGHDISMSACYRFVRLKEEIQDVIHAVTQYELSFKRQVLPILPKIRGGLLEESQLADILTLHHRSPLCAKSLLLWVQKKAREIKLLDGYIKVFKEAGVHICADDSELDAFVNDLSTTMVFALAFCVNEMLDPQVRNITSSAMSGSSAQEGKNNNWFENGRQLQHLRAQIKSFVKSADEMRALQQSKAETGNKDTLKFIVCTSYESHTNVTKMILYQEGVAEDFQWPVSPTDVAVADIMPNSVCINWKSESQSESSCHHYLVQYRQSNLKKVQPWTTIPATPDSRTLMVNSLRPNTAYEFVVAVVTAVGFSVESNVCGPVTTTPQAGTGKSTKVPEGEVAGGVTDGQRIQKISPREMVSKLKSVARFSIGELRHGSRELTPRIIMIGMEENTEEQLSGFINTLTKFANSATCADDVFYLVDQKQIVQFLNQPSTLVEVFVFPSVDSSLSFPVLLIIFKTKWTINFWDSYGRSNIYLLVSTNDVASCDPNYTSTTRFYYSNMEKRSMGDFCTCTDIALLALFDEVPLQFAQPAICSTQYASVRTILQMLPKTCSWADIKYASIKTITIYSILLAELVVYCLETCAKDPSASEFVFPTPRLLLRLANEPTAIGLDTYHCCPLSYILDNSEGGDKCEKEYVAECLSAFKSATNSKKVGVSAYEFGLKYTTDTVDWTSLRAKVFGAVDSAWLIENRNDIIALHRNRQVRYIATLLHLRRYSFEFCQPEKTNTAPYMHEASIDAELLFEQVCESNELLTEDISRTLPFVLSRLENEIAAERAARPYLCTSTRNVTSITACLEGVRDRIQLEENKLYKDLCSNYIRCFPDATISQEFLIGCGPNDYKNKN